MKTPSFKSFYVLLVSVLISNVTCFTSYANQHQHDAWHLSQQNFTARHESGLVSVDDTIYLLGGRGDKPIESFSLRQNTWQIETTSMPMELHHFQPVAIDQKIYVLGAFTGGWPNEQGVAYVLVYDTQNKTWEQSANIPNDRVRGAAAAVLYKGEIYIVGGSTQGHMTGTVTWFDKYNPETKSFERLKDAPTARDHAQAAVVGNKLYVMGGRKTSRATGDDFNLTISEVDVYDFDSQTWQTLPSTSSLPTERAGANIAVIDKYIVLMGGESARQKTAHSEVEVLDTKTNKWLRAPQLNMGRHSGGAATFAHNGEQHVIVVSGSGNRGGRPELANHELINAQVLTAKHPKDYAQSINLFDTFTAHLKGPVVSEEQDLNPFTQYIAVAKVTAPTGFSQYVRGFFVGDGRAEYTSAKQGDLWRFHFTPASTGSYQFEFNLFQGSDIGYISNKDYSGLFSDKKNENSSKLLSTNKGSFTVAVQSDEKHGVFAKNGFLGLKDGYFFFPHTQQYWLKAGANSPENLLAYAEIDGTYRSSKHDREGESKASDNLHKFATHAKDYNTGDPLWGENADKGKGLIGAINYLSSQGMNAQYFLSMNINGDGRDVFPYLTHEQFDRFDISKLAQWDVVFSHMQNKDIMLHIVTQETENERLLDGGDTGKMRSLYYSELIARFAHHKAVVWNLGEENGPAKFSPDGQTDAQRIAMARFFKENDPYQHPVLIHSHSTEKSKDEILPALFNSDYDGISFQVNYRQKVFSEIVKWRKMSAKANKNGPWLISMDEIGMWWTGAKVDADDPTHDSLRRHVLWPTFLANGAGVEWYAGGRQPQNDLGLEDFRTRESLWKQSAIAQQFISQHVPIWELSPVFYPQDTTVLIEGLDDKPDENVSAASVYAAKNEHYFIAYVIDKAQIEFDMPSGDYQMIIMDPISGTTLSKQNIRLPKMLKQKLQRPSQSNIKDWVLLLKANR